MAASVRSGESLRRSHAHEDPDQPVLIPKDKFDEYRVPQEMPSEAEIEGKGRRWSPGGWVIHRKDGRRAYYDLHIPKTAGCSFAVDIKKVLPEGEGYFSREGCWDRFKLGRSDDGRVAMLRTPASHIYSQFMECKFDDDWDPVPDSKKYLLRNFTTWLRHFDGGRTHDNLNCYDPYNMQTQALTCDSKWCHNYTGEPDPVFAFKRLDSLFFVGIVEHYQASLCLFFAKTHEGGQPLPNFCDCTDKQAWRSFRGAHVDHGLPPHSMSDLSTEDLHLIGDLSRLDAQVYQRALDRFRREAADVERRTGTKILCER